jgi:hypothetical protein
VTKTLVTTAPGRKPNLLLNTLTRSKSPIRIGKIELTMLAAMYSSNSVGKEMCPSLLSASRERYDQKK